MAGDMDSDEVSTRTPFLNTLQLVCIDKILPFLGLLRERT